METVNTKHGILKDTIISLSKMGAIYHKCDGIDIFFIIDKDSELTQGCDKLKNIRDFIMKEFGYTLKVYFKK
jgi:hypothetical protein